MLSKPEAGPPVVLSVGGFDPSSGAGVTADVKTIAAHGCYAIACITALTVQSTQGVKRFETVDARFFTETLEELASDFTIAAVHVGMLGSPEITRAIAGFVRRNQLRNVVVDPVLRSSSGTQLIVRDTAQMLKEKLIPVADVITPNIDEAADLTGCTVTNLEEMKVAAVELHKIGARNVVITGGHLNPPVDLLSLAGNQGVTLFEGEKISGRLTHGTGCAFATSLACNLALGRSVVEATNAAKQYVANGLQNAFPVGKGRVPINHLAKLPRPTKKLISTT